MWNHSEYCISLCHMEKPHLWISVSSVEWKIFLIPFFLFFTVKCGLFINSYCKHLSVSSGLRDLEIFPILKTPRSQDYFHRTSHKSAQQGAEPVQYKMYLQTISPLLPSHPTKVLFDCIQWFFYTSICYFSCINTLVLHDTQKTNRLSLLVKFHCKK